MRIDNDIELISSMTLQLETLVTRNNDSDDFHELAIWKIEQALKQAWNAGYKAALEGEKA